MSLNKEFMATSGRKNGNVEVNCGEKMEITSKGFNLPVFSI
tara:strand:- start:105 stop:227 length:123 start_codon:yes stop_codon:yes gene_type:complete